MFSTYLLRTWREERQKASPSTTIRTGILATLVTLTTYVNITTINSDEDRYFSSRGASKQIPRNAWLQNLEKSNVQQSLCKLYTKLSRLSQEDIKKMIEESEKFARMDKKVKEQAEAKLELERLAYSLKSGL